ncbi:hypothetical protein PVW51_21095 [Sulfitobacter sp. PR48]|uniref:hypothetical protein n=1 Tax=Sulfitobacter sp. PR48 TaxID=3028383 RepID=UPI00237AA3DE|nr:hypothetical protein [Sulfitobacter sp. PR48]MDD9723208.1 hypothetical protein [Sulfitobacter sp. PR48]
MLIRLFIIVALSMTSALTASAQDTFNNGVRIADGDLQKADLTVAGSASIGNLCLGLRCGEDEPTSYDRPLTIDTPKQAWIDMVNQSVAGTGHYPGRDWRIRPNDDYNGGIERFSIEDLSADTIPFSIEGGAPENAFWIDNGGGIGLGTMFPQDRLHASGAIGPGLRLEQTGNGLLPPQAWRIVGQTAFSVSDLTAGTTPFRIDRTAPTGSFHLDETGFVGLGTDAPEELLHIRSNASNTDAFALFEAAGSGSDSAFRLKQNGTTPTTWEFRNQQDSGRLNVGIAGGNTPLKIDNAANNNLLKLGINSAPDAVVVTGRLVVNNTTLNVPDYVFGADYPLRSLAEVRDFIGTNRHLPDIPSEAEIRANGVDMTEMQMAHLKKIEELTLYTLEQEDQIAALTRQNARQESEIRTLVSRLAALEALEATR